MKEAETYTEVLCGASEELLQALNQTPQRYIPTKVQGCMLGLREKLNKNSSETIEDEAEVLIDELDTISGIPAGIFSYIKNLRSVLDMHRAAS